MHKCSNCLFTSPHVSVIHDHLLSSHYTLKNIILQCRICEWQCSSFKKFKIHIDKCSIRDDDDYNCVVCNQRIKYENVRKHLLDHLKSKEHVQCPICSLNCETTSGFNSHIHRNHKNLIEFGSKKLQKFGFENPINDLNSIKTCPIPMEIDDEIFLDDYLTVNDPTALTEDEISPKDLWEDPSFQFKYDLGILLLKLKAEKGVTESALDLILHAVSNVTKIIFQTTEKIVQKNLNDFNKFNEDLKEFKETFSDLKDFKTPFLRKKYFTSHFKYVQPVVIELPLSDPTQDPKHIYYVPLADSLISLLEDKAIKDNLNKKSPREENIYQDYEDGTAFKENSYFTSINKKLELIFFQDGCGMNNPLGPSKNKDKLVFVYYTIGNLPPDIRSRSQNIQLAFAFPECFLKEGQTFTTIFQKLSEDLCTLNRIGIFNFSKEKIYGGMLMMTSDNLGAHQFGGFTCNFSKSFYLCRHCKWTNADKENGDVSIKELRTISSFDSFNGKLSFVKTSSPIDNINHISLVNGLPPCSAHNLFSSGAFSRDFLPALENMFKHQNIKVEQITSAYKEISKRIPGTTFPHINKDKLSGKMYEVYKMIVFLPVALSLIAPFEESDAYTFLKTMVEITKIVTAQKIHYDQVEELKILISNYFVLRKNAIPHERLVPKHHYLVHLPDAIKTWGPPVRYWTMFFEHKHQFFKYVASHMHNNINLNKSLAERHQYYQASKFGDRVPPTFVSDIAAPLIQTEMKLALPDIFTLKSTRLLFKNISFCTGDSVLVGASTQFFQLVKIDMFFLSKTFKNCLIQGKRSFYAYNKSKSYFEMHSTSEMDELFNIETVLHHKPIPIFNTNSLNYFILSSSVPMSST